MGQKLLNRPSATLRYANEAVLPRYVLHQTVILPLGALFVGSGYPLAVEVLVVSVGTVIACLAQSASVVTGTEDSVPSKCCH